MPGIVFGRGQQTMKYDRPRKTRSGILYACTYDDSFIPRGQSFIACLLCMEMVSDGLPFSFRGMTTDVDILELDNVAMTPD